MKKNTIKQKIKNKYPLFWKLALKIYWSIKKLSPQKKIERELDKKEWYLRLKEGVQFSQESIVLITMDSLRYDVSQIANTPNFKKLFEKNNSTGWYNVGSHGTYTLPSHISMFHAGLMPCNNRENIPAPFNRNKEKIFKVQLAWERTTGAKFPTPAAPNVIKGFEKIGYRTIGIGGVHWFNNKLSTSDIWGKNYFNEFYWKEKFAEKNFKSLEHQIKLIRKLNLRTEKKPIFLFLNISYTHTPYLGFGKSLFGQKTAFEAIDKLLPSLLCVLPTKCHLMVCSDHGECFGEDGLWGHGFYHPKIMEVPFAYVKLNL